ncbi:hypothetical protein GCM10007426_14170 [Alloalcanivorax dieselolei]|nr:hypothetical protein GCM10007426_14170 [Alloalcanivorax dieselolei]
MPPTQITAASICSTKGTAMDNTIVFSPGDKSANTDAGAECSRRRGGQHDNRGPRAWVLKQPAIVPCLYVWRERGKLPERFRATLFHLLDLSCSTVPVCGWKTDVWPVCR